MADNRSNRNFLVHEIERLKAVLAEKDFIINLKNEEIARLKAGSEDDVKSARKLTKPVFKGVEDKDA